MHRKSFEIVQIDQCSHIWRNSVKKRVYILLIEQLFLICRIPADLIVVKAFTDALFPHFMAKFIIAEVFCNSVQPSTWIL